LSGGVSCTHGSQELVDVALELDHLWMRPDGRTVGTCQRLEDQPGSAASARQRSDQFAFFCEADKTPQYHPRERTVAAAGDYSIRIEPRPLVENVKLNRG
jgi:hypothetical protein